MFETNLGKMVKTLEVNFMKVCEIFKNLHT